MKEQYGKWKVEKTLRQDRCYLASSEGRKGVVKVGRNVNHEIEALKSIGDHPYIVKLVDYDLESEPCFLVTEYCEGGNLRECHYEEWEDVHIYEFALKVYDAIEHMQSKGFHHKNNELNNIFISYHGAVPYPVIGDFETAKKVGKDLIRDDMSRIFKELIKGIESDRYAKMLRRRHSLYAEIRHETHQELRFSRPKRRVF